MFELKVITHCEVGQNDLNQIIKVKSLAWPYTYQMQIKWMNENLNGSDLHLILNKDSKTVAYLNLINIDLRINNKECQSFGIGNVCSAENGKGYGNELMKLTNRFIKEDNKPGLLFCKPSLVGFYEKFYWAVIEKNKLKLKVNNMNFETMYFNIAPDLQLLEYYGHTF